jgi:hypothetical protein
MKYNELLNAILKFNDQASERKVILKNEKLVSEYKVDSNVNLETVNNAIAKIGLNHIYIAKNVDKSNNKSAYAISVNGNFLFNILDDIQYRFITYPTIKKRISKYMYKYTEEEIIAFIGIAAKMLYELIISEINIDCISDISENQQQAFSKNSIFTYNSVFIPYVINEIEAHKEGNCFCDHIFFIQLYEYLFCEDFPEEYFDFGEKKQNDHIVYGLKLTDKEETLSDFFEEFCSKKIVDILYKKSYSSDKKAFEEALKCVYYLTLGLESTIS